MTGLAPTALVMHRRECKVTRGGKSQDRSDLTAPFMQPETLRAGSYIQVSLWLSASALSSADISILSKATTVRHPCTPGRCTFCRW